MLRFKKCDKKFPRMESESRDENEPQDLDPGWSGGEMTRHRYLVTATILASPQPAATPRSAQQRSRTSRCYDGYTTQASDDITSQKCVSSQHLYCFLCELCYVPG